ncbi:MAG: hypothetical protein V1794_01590 [Candidatus Glassbacteria bacterium]
MNKIRPAFKFGKPIQSIILKKTTASLLVNGTSYDGTAEVRLDLLPRAGVYIYAEFMGMLPIVVLDVMSNHKTIDKFILERENIPGFFLNLGGSIPGNTTKLKWCLYPEQLIWGSKNSTTTKYLIFHIFNFMDFVGTSRSVENNGKTKFAVEYVDFKSNDWIVELKSLRTTRDNIEKLKARGGYGLTHIGSIRKTDESNFSAKEASTILTAISYFLSFAKGIWCIPVCAVGFDEAGDRIWESWNSPREPWYEPLSWFDKYHTNQLIELFPGFIEKWKNEDWRKTFENVIYWYLNANNSSSGIDAGIILTQAGIERLSFEYAVKCKKLIEKSGFKELRASDKFRLLFSSLDIPIEISNHLESLKKLGKQLSWIDAPHALTEIRNSLVHPEHKQHGKISDHYFDAWNLGLWYLELSLLRICDYSGSYRNRLTAKYVGQTEEVPWKC